MRAERIRIPPELQPALEAARKVGRPRLVGGCVRDWLLGLEPKDFDVEVAGTTFERLHAALAPLGATDVVGRSFGVIKLRVGGHEHDFSLPRRESKTGAGHRGFQVSPDPDLTDAEAAARRDFTINSIAYDPFTGAVIDPHGGEADLRRRILRHTGPGFAEDPLRALRAFQFAGRFDLSLAPETAKLCREIAPSFAELPVERVWGEWEKWAVKSVRPSRGLAVLEESGWLVHFPEVAAMRGVEQEPEWHPEGDVFTHTQHCLDALVRQPQWQAADPARRAILSFAVLAHDFGKAGTTVRAERRGRIRITSPGHESAGGPLAQAFLRRIGAPLDFDAPVAALVVSHLAHHHGAQVRPGVAAPAGAEMFSDSQVRRLARKLAPATIDDLALVVRADAAGRPPLPPEEVYVLVDQLVEKAHQLAIQSTAPRPILMGRHLLAAGMKAGPEFRTILDAAMEAQLDGAFGDEAGALEWLRRYPASAAGRPAGP